VVQPWAAGAPPGRRRPACPSAASPRVASRRRPALLAEEPDRGESDITFTHQASAHEKERLSLRGLLLEYPGMLVLAVVLVGIIAVATQLGPKLTGIAIDDGMEPGHHDFGFVVLIAGPLPALGRGLRRRPVGPGPGDRPPGLLGDERPAGHHFPPPATPLPRLLHRGEGGRGHEPDDQRHREPAAAPPGRSGPIRHSGADHGGHRHLPVHHQRAAGHHHRCGGHPPAGHHVVWFKRASERGYDKVRDGIALVLADLSESLQGVRIVTAHNRQRHNVVHHRNVVGRYRDANNYTGRINGIYGPGSQLLGVIGQVVILAVGGDMVLHHQLQIGALTPSSST
jgi:ABC-type multidrug transport system fused ATPase/permease subunit